MSDFAKTMRDWRRMCDMYTKQYGTECGKYCPLHQKDCGAIWEIQDGTYDNIAKTVDAWAAKNPEPVYPTWAEWLMSIGVISGLFPKGAIDAPGNLKLPIPANIAEKLGLKPKGEGNDV